MYINEKSYINTYRPILSQTPTGYKTYLHIGVHKLHIVTYYVLTTSWTYVPCFVCMWYIITYNLRLQHMVFYRFTRICNYFLLKNTWRFYSRFESKEPFCLVCLIEPLLVWNKFVICSSFRGFHFNLYVYLNTTPNQLISTYVPSQH